MQDISLAEIAIDMPDGDFARSIRQLTFE